MSQLENVEPLNAALVEAYRGRPYEEIRTREVEHGYIARGDKDYPRPYPYRVPKEPRSYVQIQIDAKWDIVQDSEGGFTLLLYAEDKTYSIPITDRSRIENRQDELKISVG